jgi:hypothetical protein
MYSRKSIFIPLLTISLVLGATAQINFKSNAINFRTTADRAQTSTHYGRFVLEDEHYSASNAGIHVTNIMNTTLGDPFAIRGLAIQRAYFGIGVEGQGGYVGVKGLALVSGSGSRRGVWGEASGGSISNYGVYGTASGTNAYAGYFQGNVYCSGSYLPSDEKLKKNIVDYSGALDKLLKLKPKTYEYDISENPGMCLPTGQHSGLIAQELELVLPNAVKDVPVERVSTDSTKSDTVQYIKAINYTELVPMLIAAIQEQQKEIDALKAGR